MPTFLFTDIEGSTSLWSRYPHIMREVLSRHDRLIGDLVTEHGGRVVKHLGDGLFAVFNGGEPLACAIEIQRRLGKQDWGEVDELRVRVALHTGVAEQREMDYFGLEVSRTARLLSAGWGGQILLTCELARAAQLPPEAALHDLGNHVLKDLSAPLHIYQLLHPDLPLQEFPPLRTLSAHPHNLPPQPTPFVGRTRELQEIAVCLADPTCRLLTLVGPGGIGKTRLALQAAAAHVEIFDHGVYFVPLEALSSAEFVVAAIAEALDFSFYQRDVPQRQLFSYLQEKQVLLVLDNFEHVMEGVSLVSELLTHAPQIKLLVTSRERLNVRGELTLTVEGMDFPTEASAPDIELYSAVQLFLQYARRVKPSFTLTPLRRAAVVQICMQVQGMPLALELAASWLRVLTSGEIVTEMEESTDFLSSSLRDVPERHRSLRAVFEYSWQLLNEVERSTIRGLAVFQGAFRRKAAFAVLREPGSNMRSLALLEVLAALVDKSLLQRRVDGMYAMHPLLHEYAREKLQFVPDQERQIRQRHSAYYADFLQQRSADLEGAEQRAALTAIAEVLTDIREAWLWAVEERQVALLEQGLHGLGRFFSLSGRNQEGIPLFEFAIAALEPLSTREAETVRGWLLAHAADLATNLAGAEQAQALTEKALTLNRRLEIASASALALIAQGRLAWLQGRYEIALEYYQEALDLYTVAGDLGGQARVLDNLGATAWTVGEYDAARSYFERSLELYRKRDNPHGIASMLDHLGVVARDTGDLKRAREFFEQSYESMKSLGARMSLAYTANHLGGVIAMAGDLEEAQPYFEQCIALGKELGERRIVAYTLYDWADALEESGDTAAALSMLAESEKLFEALGDPFGEIPMKVLFGNMALQSGDLEGARSHYLDAVNAAVAVQNLRLVSMSLTSWARYLVATERWLPAVEILGFVETLPGDSPEARETWEELLAQLRTLLPADTFSAALERGLGADLSEICPTE